MKKVQGREVPFCQGCEYGASCRGSCVSRAFLEHRDILEQKKIECARKFFEKIELKQKSIKYDVVDSYGKLMEIVGVKRTC